MTMDDINSWLYKTTFNLFYLNLSIIIAYRSGFTVGRVNKAEGWFKGDTNEA